MRTELETIKLSTLIDNLKRLKSEYGDLNVYLSTDEEGNSYGNINKEFWNTVGIKGKNIIIYPYCSSLDYDDIQ